MVDEEFLFVTRPVESTLSDGEEQSDNDEDESEGGEEERRKFAFPELDTQIREAISRYGAVFPKLNFSSPRVGVASPFDSISIYTLNVR